MTRYFNFLRLLLPALYLTTASTLFSSAAFASDATLIASIGVTQGGHTLLSPTSGEKLKAGSGFDLHFGRVFNAPFLDVPTRINVGMRADQVDTEHGEARFHRFPIEVLPVLQTPTSQWGVGISYHVNPTFVEELDGGTRKINFKNALGLVLQLDMDVAPSMSVGVRLESLRYESAETGEIDGDNIGIHFNYYY